MCQAKVILEDGQKGKVILEDVIHLRVEGDKIWFERFFEEPTAVIGTIGEVDFLKHQVCIVPIEQGER